METPRIERDSLGLQPSALTLKAKSPKNLHTLNEILVICIVHGINAFSDLDLPSQERVQISLHLMCIANQVKPSGVCSDGPV